MSKKEITRYGYRGLGLISVLDGEILEFGNRKITCILTPGHTEGSMCFQVEDSVFTGDTLFIEGCGVCNLTGSDPGEMFESLQMLKRNIQPNVKVFPGHAFNKLPGERFINICRDNIYLNIDSKDKFVDFRMRPIQIRKDFI